ncbi:MAG TPA: AMP-binding protein, partial [Polyangiaceae bacterium]|nr:AMP-binding protein [Polyangiaceae bacterium]
MSDLIERFGALGRSRAPAVIDPNERVGFDELVRRAEQSARGLSAAGLGGQRIALLIEPSAAFVEALFATLLAGAVAVPLCLQHPPPEHLHVLDSSGAAAIVASPGLLDAAAAIARGRPVHRVAD